MIGDYDDWPRERIAAVIDDLMAASPIDRQSKMTANKMIEALEWHDKSNSATKVNR